MKVERSEHKYLVTGDIYKYIFQMQHTDSTLFPTVGSSLQGQRETRFMCEKRRAKSITQKHIYMKSHKSDVTLYNSLEVSVQGQGEASVIKE